jgi:translation initiation factor eIF-2B subunit gamma
LNNVIVMDNLVIGDNCVHQNSILCENCVIEKNCNLNDCQVGPKVVIKSQTKEKKESFTEDYP